MSSKEWSDRIPVDVALRETAVSATDVFEILSVAVDRPPFTYTHLSPGECLACWVGTVLWRMPGMTTPVAQALLRSLRPVLHKAGTLLHAQQSVSDTAIPVLQLVFADGHYVTWTGNRGFLDVHTGETIDQLPMPALTTTAYNLVELFRRRWTAAMQQKDGHGYD